MKLEEAIKIKELTGDEFLAADPDDIDEADRLSNEALKRDVRHRLISNHPDQALLPGETKE